MIIESKDEKNKITGKYEYKNKEEYLKLTGFLKGNCVFLEEHYQEEKTGAFYLELMDNQLQGNWANEKKHYEVSLEIISGNREILETKPLDYYTKKTSDGISGAYLNEQYYINDMWVQEDNPAYEIGFSGGYILLDSIHSDSLKFEVQTICGPTYHGAYAEGIAIKKGEIYEYIIDEWEEECIIEISINDKSVYARASGGSLSCGFGARAYLEHTFVKVNDRFEFEEPFEMEELKER